MCQWWWHLRFNPWHQCTENLKENCIFVAEFTEVPILMVVFSFLRISENYLHLFQLFNLHLRCWEWSFWLSFDILWKKKIEIGTRQRVTFFPLYSEEAKNGCNSWILEAFSHLTLYWYYAYLWIRRQSWRDPHSSVRYARKGAQSCNMEFGISNLSLQSF